MRDPRLTRRAFFEGLVTGISLTWPILSGLCLAMLGLGAVTGLFEGWSLTESIYFAFVSALTIGYGDLAPVTTAGRVLAIAIGVCGILLTALLAGIAVKAMETARTVGDGK